VFPIWRSSSGLGREESARGRRPSRAAAATSAAEWKVRASTPSTPAAASRAAHLARGLVGERDREDLVERTAPLRTCHAIRRVIVVVFPDPAPARMQTGPRTASAARRCSGFSPSRITEPP
jgi:hypothetical protein